MAKSKTYRTIQKNREYVQKTVGVSSLEEMMELNKEYWHLSGYKPISDRFRPDWFRPAIIQYEKNNKKYTTAPYGSKAYRDFWTEEIRRCREGYKVKGYFCPGDLYYWLNYYKLPVPRADGSARELGPPLFWEVHYIFAHVVEWAKKLKKNLVALKPRGVGWSEYVAAMAANLYTTTSESVTMFTASNEDYLDGIMSKWHASLDWNNNNTQRGFKLLSQAKNTKHERRASMRNKEGIEFGHMSKGIGIIADKPGKVRGARTNLLIFEEFGSYKESIKTLMTSRDLMEVGGIKFGIAVCFGTGGDEGSQGKLIEGLMHTMNRPDLYDMLKLKHKFTPDGQVRESGFFFPAYTCMMKYNNKQGVTDIEEAHKECLNTRKAYQDAGAIKEHQDYAAEKPFYIEEAFAKGGTNHFNTIKAANQELRLTHEKGLPKPQKGELEFVYKEGTSKITGVEWIPNPQGRVEIIEEPEMDSTGKPFKNLYIGGIDSIDMGSDNSLVGEAGSKFAVVIKKRFLTSEKTGNMYVAKYHGRPGDERDAYLIALKLAIWYGAKMNVERTRKEVISYFRNHRMLRYMAKAPSIATENLNNQKKSNMYGTPVNEKIIHHGLGKLKEYIDDFCNIIFFPDMLKEIREYAYERKTSFDLIAAMQQCELLDEEYDASALFAKTNKNLEQDLEDWGYYTDPVTGYKKFGPIPKNQTSALKQYERLGLENPDDIYREENYRAAEHEHFGKERDDDGFDWVEPEEAGGELSPNQRFIFEL